MPAARVELQVSFAAAHRVDSPRAGCPGLHGHSYRLRVALEGEVDPESGTVADLPRVEEILQELVYRPFDHGTLNDHLPNPTLERVAAHILGKLHEALPQVVEVRLEDGSGRSASVGRATAGW